MDWKRHVALLPIYVAALALLAYLIAAPFVFVWQLYDWYMKPDTRPDISFVIMLCGAVWAFLGAMYLDMRGK